MAIENKKAQCKIIVYDWDLKTYSPDESEANLAKATRKDISKHLDGTVSYTKSLSSPAGSFDFMLDATKPWKEIIRRDSWCLIYMSNEGELPMGEGKIPDAKYLRGICYIERVSKNKVVDEDGSENVSYSVSGRDFGKIYEDTQIWLNPLLHERISIKGFSAKLKHEAISTTDKLIQTAHSLFFSAKFDVDGVDKFAQTAQQWILPEALFKDLGLVSRKGKVYYYGLIKDLVKTSPTTTTIPISNPFSDINGNAWARLKEWSIEPLHELFCELDSNGKPTLNYRPIPWAMNTKGYPSLKGNITTYRKLIEDSNINIKGVEIFAEDLGEDSHNRYNHFYAQTSVARQTNFSNVSVLSNQESPAGRKFPYVDEASIKRNGFKPMHTTLNTLTNGVTKTKGGVSNSAVLLEYNEVLRDYWSPAVYLESGSISILGRNDIKIGMAIKFDRDAGDLAGKAFYIEGYQDEFEIDGEGSRIWTQNLQVTRGIEFDRLAENTSDEDLEKINDTVKSGVFVED